MNIERMIQNLKRSCDGCNHVCEGTTCQVPLWLAAKTFPQLFFLESWYQREVGEVPGPSDDVLHDIRSCTPPRILHAAQNYLANLADAHESGLIDDEALALLLPPAIHYLRSLTMSLKEMPEMSNAGLRAIDENGEVGKNALLAS